MNGNESRSRGSAIFARVPLGLALLVIIAIAVLVPEARGLAIGGIVLVTLLALAPRGRRRAGAIDPSQPRRVSHWPAAGIRAVVEAMPEPALLTDADLNLRFRNEASAKAFGEIGLGDPISLRFRAPPFLAAAQAAVAASEPRRVDEIERLSADRSWSIDILPVREKGQNRPTFFLFLFRDRTAERRTEKMRTDFVANASHELRTPLSSLIGFIETLQGPARDDGKARDRFLDIMRVEAGRMSRLIDDLLSLSRIETKRALNQGDQADLVEVAAIVRETLMPMAEADGVAIEITGGEAGALLVRGDRDELVQVVSNLVENGCKYAASGKRIVIALACPDKGSAELSVRDFGPGIADAHVPRLTERFYRVEEAKGPRIRGTGLGLSIVRNILSRHGTRLQIASRLGDGATFSFRLRRKNPE